MEESTPLALRGFRFHDAPIQWVLAPTEPKVATLQQLLQRFYNEFDPSEPLTYKPLGLIRNPTDSEGRAFYCFDETLVAAYRRGFLVVCECAFRRHYGPHPIRLLYKSYQTGDLIWVAILQIENVFFFSDDAMLPQITDAIKQSLFFQTPRTAKTIVAL